MTPTYAEFCALDSPARRHDINAKFFRVICCVPGLLGAGPTFENLTSAQDGAALNPSRQGTLLGVQYSTGASPWHRTIQS